MAWRPSLTLTGFVLAAALAAAAPAARGQVVPPLGALVGEGTLLAPSAESSPVAAAATQPTNVIVDPQVQPAASSYPGYEYEPGPAPVMMTQPTNWISGPYLKGGTNLVLGEDLITDTTPGYTIEGGYRVPIGPAFGDRTFLDFGGSYLSAFGDTTHLTDGFSIITINGTVISTTPVADLFASTLSEVKRGSAHIGVGWYWGDEIDNRSNDPQLRFATTLGGRWGHVRGRFFDIAQQAPGANETFDANYSHTDTSAGLYAAVQALLLNRDTAIGSTAITLDGEFANDWIDFGGWDRGSLGTASIMLGVMISR